MLDKILLKKQILKTLTSYTHDAAPMLTEADFSFLIEKIEEQARLHPKEALHHIVHDVVYEYVTAYF